ncbi:MAG: choice-of-anchor Q domain-containing protein [Pirellulales bacterium]
MFRRTPSRRAASRQFPKAKRIKSRAALSINHRCLRFEPLEDRRLLAVVTVDTLDDAVDFNDGAISLREAIFATNLVGGADTIEFAPSLTSTGPAKILLTGGELAITDVLTITGPGANLLTIDAQQQSRIFNITANTGDYTISSLALTEGKTSGVGYEQEYAGGALRSSTIGSLTLINCVVDKCGTTGDSAGGGGVFSAGPLTLVDTVISNNTGNGILCHNDVTLNGSTVTGNSAIGVKANGDVTLTSTTISANLRRGVSSSSGRVDMIGGIVRDNRDGGIFGPNVSITDGVVSGNSRTQGDGGGINGFTVTLNNSIVSGNSISGHIAHGGGIYALTVTLDHSTVSGNSTSGSISKGGGIYCKTLRALNDSIVSGNSTSGDLSDGGGVYATNVTLNQSTVSGNHTVGIAAGGGGISAQSVIVNQSAVYGNSALGSVSDGGGIDCKSLIMNQSTVFGNIANGDGGGIYVESSATITTSTITGNSTTSDGGGGLFTKGNLSIDRSTISGNAAADRNSSGGGIYCLGSAQISDSTISDNIAGDRGGGIVVRGPGSISLTKTVVSNNSAYRSGGGVDSAGAATITGCVVTGNLAYQAGGITCGGSLTVRDSRITGNTATGSNGGGIISSGALSLINTTVSSNQAAQNGGGAYCYGDLTVVSSTIASNIASRSGGGITALGSIQLSNATVSQNTATSLAGGIWCRGSSTTVSQSTIYRNQSSGAGGGVFMDSGALSLEGSIVAGNFAESGTDATGLLGASIHARFSVIGNHSGSGLAPAPVGSPDADGNLVGGSTFQSMIDPKLGPLADNGGLMRTLALLPGSPALNTGDPNASAGAGGLPQFDQRDAPFIRVFGGRIDIGAYERQTLPLVNYVVDSLADESDGNFSSGHLSLREAIGMANGDVGSAQVITFAPSLTSQGPAVIVLTRGDLTITDLLTINGLGNELLTVDASGNDRSPDSGNGSRVFGIDDGDTSTKISVAISGLTLTGGDVADGGGAILSLEGLAVVGSTICGNFATNGGGIRSFGPLSLVDCTVSGNTASGSGGGISNNYAATTISGCTIAGNSALQGNGGGIAISGSRSTIALDGSVISDNSAAGFGGGIYTFGSLTLNNDVVGDNEAQGGGGILAFGAVTVMNSVIARNAATLYSGGGMYVSGSLTVLGSTIIANSANAGSGGGILAQSAVTLTNSTLSDNSALQGGAIYCAGGTSPVKIAFSTIVANAVPSPNGRGGGIFFSGNSLNLSGSIVATNSGAFGPDLSLGGVNANIVYSLIGHNQHTALLEAPVGSPDANGNLIGGPVYGAIDPLLSPLAHNGGPTQTHALLPSSPAINSGDPATVAGMNGVPLHDQRGAPWSRVHGGRIDIGAFESQPNPLPGDYNFDGKVNVGDFTAWRDTLGSTTDLRANGDDSNGVIDEADYGVWTADYGETLGAGASVEERGASAVDAAFALFDQPRITLKPLRASGGDKPLIPQHGKALLLLSDLLADAESDADVSSSAFVYDEEETPDESEPAFEAMLVSEFSAD